MVTIVLSLVCCCIELITFGATDVIKVVGSADEGRTIIAIRNYGFVVGIRHGTHQPMTPVIRRNNTMFVRWKNTIFAEQQYCYNIVIVVTPKR